MAIGVYYLLPMAGVAQAVLLTVLNGSAAGCAYLAASRTRGRGQIIWVLLGVAMTFSTLANGPYYGFPLLTGRSLPFPSAVDVLWLLTYPCFVVALIAMVKVQRREDRRANALDATILVVSGGMLMTEFVLLPVVRAAGLPLLAHVVAIAYPTMDLLVFAMLVRVAITVSWRSPLLRLLLLSFFVLLVGDTVQSLQVSAGTYHIGGPADGIWMGSYLLIGVAALHPGASRLGHLTPSSGQRLSGGRLAFLCVSVLTGPILVATHPTGLLLATAATAVSFMLVMARMTRLNRALVSISIELESRASTDSLTGLANRAAFYARLEATLALPQDREAVQAVLFVDIDDFKDVNDTLGHDAGDALLRIVADRLLDVVRPADLVARLGGDEFAILLDAVPDLAAACSVAQRARESLSDPALIHGRQVHVGASIGLALRQASSEPDGLMRQSDVAMYNAKASGKNRVEIYDAALDDALVDYHSLKNDILAAAGRAELLLQYHQ